MKKVLITGGAGYIGSMLATDLIKLGYKVTIIDLMKYSETSIDHLHFNRNFEFINGDATNPKLLKLAEKFNRDGYIVIDLGLSKKTIINTIQDIKDHAIKQNTKN